MVMKPPGAALRASSTIHCRRYRVSWYSTLRQEKGAPNAAADILYKNPEAIANRLYLFHMMRLQVQARIDSLALQRSKTTGCS